MWLACVTLCHFGVIKGLHALCPALLGTGKLLKHGSFSLVGHSELEKLPLAAASSMAADLAFTKFRQDFRVDVQVHEVSRRGSRSCVVLRLPASRGNMLESRLSGGKGKPR